MSSEKQPPFLGIPEGEVHTEQPDGLMRSNRFDPVHNLYDDTGRPAIQSGDWQVRPPGFKPRGRP